MLIHRKKKKPLNLVKLLPGDVALSNNAEFIIADMGWDYFNNQSVVKTECGMGCTYIDMLQFLLQITATDVKREFRFLKMYASAAHADGDDIYHTHTITFDSVAIICAIIGCETNVSYQQLIGTICMFSSHDVTPKWSLIK